MTVELRPSSSLSLGERSELFNAAYEGYLLPFHIDEQQLAFMANAFDFDLDASRIAYRDGEPVGLGNLGVRGEDAWIGGVGVAPGARRSGIGEALMRALHEQARELGVRRVWLEVIVENTAAFTLYEKLGYQLVQDVEVWTLPGADGDHAGREVSRAEAESRLPERHEPWQRADGTLSNYDDVRGLVTDNGAMLFCVRSTAQLQQYAGDPEPLLDALRSFGDVYVLNLPAEDPAASVLREHGGSVVVHQHEMLLEL
ncbi:MAG TPA: GNAT family N-acetyltransferase [Gaiellaceae bacterium]|nr:GNAT family N-acetyltransferase [Gaiellaceae bacterium]